MKIECPSCDNEIEVENYTDYLECPNCSAVLIDHREETRVRPWE